MVVDWENPYEINFYNLKGESFANSVQVELNYNVARDLDLRAAYKYYDVQTDYRAGRRFKPLVPKHRVFANLAYELSGKNELAPWKFDATYNWVSEQRFPDTSLSPPEFQLDEFSPTVGTLHLQVTKVFSPQFEVIFGRRERDQCEAARSYYKCRGSLWSKFLDTNFVYGPHFRKHVLCGPAL